MVKIESRISTTSVVADPQSGSVEVDPLKVVPTFFDHHSKNALKLLAILLLGLGWVV